MTTYLELELRRPDSDARVEMVFELLDNPISRVFCELIDIANAAGARCDTSWAMTTGRAGIDELVADLNRGITRFNELNLGSGHIDHRVAVDTVDNDVLNAVHSDFEHYQKARRAGETEVVSSHHPDEIATVLSGINTDVHKLEDCLAAAQAESSPHFASYFTATLKGSDQLMFKKPLRRRDYRHFTMGESFGTAYVNYATTGKSLQHAWFTEDLEAIRTPGGISPQQVNASGIIALFNSYEKSHADEFERFSQWCTEHRVSDHGFRIKSKRNSLGLLPLGKLTPTATNQAYYVRAAERFDPHAVVDHYEPYSQVVSMVVASGS